MKKLIPKPLLHVYHFLFALFAALLYRFPSRELIVIGVTGTNGKTTVVDLTHQVFVEAGYKVASASSIRFIIGDKKWKNELKMTMPGRFFVQRFLRDAIRAKCDVVILEVTSEGIMQSRHRFIQFDTAAFTNITKEHIEAHGGFERYRRAKARLFKAVAKSKKKGRTMILNGDDEESTTHFLQYQRSEAWIYGLDCHRWKEFGKTIEPGHYSFDERGVSFVYNNIEMRLKLLGKFNLYNALCAFTIALSRGIHPERIRDAFEKITGVPGRIEYVLKPPFSVFSVVVDYAHTPDALLNVYEAVKGSKGKMICVLGSAGGGRDIWKRPEMGQIADEWCDQIFLTTEDPYDEDPEKIIGDIKSGIIKKKPTIILDRKEAVTRAVQSARADDVVVVTGKGSESLMMGPRGKKIAWDDRQVVRDAVRN
ncbi:MAG: UDP-N-acetylmuramoyl-L-alanyl-D-glutamate--2,6-diaminopimelate ligase [bacterium]|nr:UDP-N-acetylmuramoyl-L-alanyl-D-glutamate--2,6-diaminopimelate ligase [bacterium]